MTLPLSTEQVHLSHSIRDFCKKLQAELGIQAPTPLNLPSPKTTAQLIDHTLLKADATEKDLKKLCEEALQHQFATVCVNSQWIPLCSQLLKNSSTLPITVVGFPLGASTSKTKAFEAREAIQNGAREIDMVIAVGLLKDRNYEAVFKDILAVVQASHPLPVKVILETALLTPEEKIAACVISQEAGAHFVKTSTGFGPSGATAEDIALMRTLVGPGFGVKASGGVRSWDATQKMVQAGANRIGTSSGAQILREAQGQAAPHPTPGPENY
jgi:deoxyribose-phosphate aldolase